MSFFKKVFGKGKGSGLLGVGSIAASLIPGVGGIVSAGLNGAKKAVDQKKADDAKKAALNAANLAAAANGVASPNEDKFFDKALVWLKEKWYFVAGAGVAVWWFFFKDAPTKSKGRR